MGAQRADEHGLRYEELRQVVRERHATASALAPADPGRGPAVERLVEATDEWLRFEDRLPVLLDLPARALSVQAVRAAALAAVLGAVLVVIGIWNELLSRWWVVAVPAAAVAGVRLVTLRVAPAAGRHRRQRWLATSTGLTALLLAPVEVIFGWAPGLAVLAALGLCLALLLELPRRRS